MPVNGQGFHRFDRMIQGSFNFQESHRKEANISWDYVNGKQWTKDEETRLDNIHQAPIVVNILFPLINAIAAVELNRRTDYAASAKEASDKSIAQVVNQVLVQILSENRLKFLLGKTFYKAMIAGIAWIEIYPQEDPDTGDVVIKMRQVPFEHMYYDQFEQTHDLADAKFISREKWMDFDEAEELFGKEKAEELLSFYNVQTSSFTGNEEAGQSAGGYQYTNREQRRVAVHDFWYRNASGKVHHVIFSGSVFLKGSEDDSDNQSPYKYHYIPYVPCIPLFDKEGKPLGIVEIGRPIQDSINKAESKQQFLQAVRGCLFETGTFVDPKQARQDWAKPDRFIEVNEGRLGLISQDDNSNESQILIQRLGFLVNVLQRIMGVNESLIGAGGPNARSAIQEQTRIGQGEGMQAPHLDALYYTKSSIYKIAAKMMGQFYTEERMIRYMGPGGTEIFTRINSTIENDDGEEVPFNNIPDMLRFDLDVKEELPFTNARELTARTLSDVMRNVPITTPALIGPTMQNLSGIDNQEFIETEVQKLFEQNQGQTQQ